MSRAGAHSSKLPGETHWEEDMAYVRRMKSILKRERLSKNMSFRQLGESTGISFGYLANSERSDNQPTLLTFKRWCRALSIKLEDVCAEAEAEN
jgi:transcriptional regulator with XRE-family HTH domain